jgi:predicted molibdopterin-dependent oxidoreductase YjgC
MLDRQQTILVSFDGVEQEAYIGESILECAKRVGVAIPSLCFLEGLSVWGGCRICVVEIAEDHRLRPACATTCVADMEVKTDTPRLRAYRKAILELLFAEGNHVCAVCVSNGRCELQDMAVMVGMDHVRYDYQAPHREIPTAASCAPGVFAFVTRSRAPMCGTSATAASRPSWSQSSTGRGAKRSRARGAESASPSAQQDRSSTRVDPSVRWSTIRR